MTNLKTIEIHKDYKYKNDVEFALCMRNRLWRLNNLYMIRTKDGSKIPFKLNWAQLELLENMHTRNVILKARQLGMSTFIMILSYDAVFWHDSVTATVIAHNREDAEELFLDKIKFAHDQMFPQFGGLRKEISDSARKLAFDNNSHIRVGTSTRSGTPQILHVSEYGKIAAKYPEKAREIKTGSFNAVGKDGFIFVESTAEGRDGYFYDLVETARNIQKSGQELTPLDFKFHFFPWWKHPDYCLEQVRGLEVNKEIKEYFEKLEVEEKIILDLQQKLWYMVTSGGTINDDMKREFPSTADEAFEASVIGSYFCNQMTKARKEDRICLLPFEPGVPVNTAWDIGVRDSNIIIFFQYVGEWIHVIDYHEDSGEGLPYYVRLLREKAAEGGWIYGSHYAPHDIDVQEWGTGKTRIETALDLGVAFVPIKRARKIEADYIESARNHFPKVKFSSTNCTRLIKCLDAFQKEWNDKMGCFNNSPLHNWASHGSSAFMMMIKAFEIFGINSARMTQTSIDDLYTQYGPPVL